MTAVAVSSRDLWGKISHGKGGTRLIRPADLQTVRAAVANYARLKRLVDRWIDLATERSDLTLQLRAAANRPAKRR